MLRTVGPVRGIQPLGALRSFDAAARHGSFTLAAEELGVTHTTISRRVRSLEENLGFELFIRRPRSLSLTEEGCLLANHTLHAFDLLARGVDAVRAAKSRQHILMVGVSPTCGQLWLAHRLNHFWCRHADIELRVHCSVNTFNLPADVDIAIRLGHGRWSGVEAEFMIESCLAPFCSPALKNGKIPLQMPDDLRHHTLLHAYDYELWRHWLAAANVHNNDCERGPILDDLLVLERAAIDGRGIALCTPTLLGDDLSDGRLVQAFPDIPETEFSFYIVYAPGALKNHKVRVFRDFLLEEVRQSNDFAPDVLAPLCCRKRSLLSGQRENVCRASSSHYFVRECTDRFTTDFAATSPGERP